ncbi:MAG: hypothetical protein CMI31_09620 [Opitutae bacterium]|nr:hypothetical protein [Opitutae bacterium]
MKIQREIVSAYLTDFGYGFESNAEPAKLRQDDHFGKETQIDSQRPNPTNPNGSRRDRAITDSFRKAKAEAVRVLGISNRIRSVGERLSAQEIQDLTQDIIRLISSPLDSIEGRKLREVMPRA